MVAAARITKDRAWLEMATATSSSQRWSGEVDYDDFRPIALLQRRCHIGRVTNDDAGGMAEMVLQGQVTSTAMDIMVRWLLMTECSNTRVQLQRTDNMNLLQEMNASVRKSSVKKA